MTEERGPASPRPDPSASARVPADPGGLCPRCRHVKLVASDRGSVFFLCQLARRDPSLPRYPPQPRLVCHAFER